MGVRELDIESELKRQEILSVVRTYLKAKRIVTLEKFERWCPTCEDTMKRVIDHLLLGVKIQKGNEELSLPFHQHQDPDIVLAGLLVIGDNLRRAHPAETQKKAPSGTPRDKNERSSRAAAASAVPRDIDHVTW